MKHTVHFVSVCLLVVTLMTGASSCSTSKKAAADTQKKEQPAAEAKKKNKISLWHWFGKKQKAYVYSCYQGEAQRYLYSYDGLIWKYLNDADGEPVTAIPEGAVVKRSRVLSKYPELVSGTLSEGNDPQVMKIAKYTYVYWNKAITGKIGCVRTKYSLNNENDLEDASSYVSFPKGIRLESLCEVKPQVLASLMGL